MSDKNMADVADKAVDKLSVGIETVARAVEKVGGQVTDPDTLPANDPPDCEECGESEDHDPDCSEYVATSVTERRISALETERRTASFGRSQQIGGELEELYIRLGYEKTGRVAL